MDPIVFYFFTGENSYTLSEELQRWKTTFREKYGPENILILKAGETSVSDILDAVSTMPFIAEKRLVIVEGVPKIDKEDVALIAESLHPATIFVIADSKPDKRIGAVKEIEKRAEIKQFSPLSPQELRTWIRSLVSSLGSSITADAEKHLLETVGTEQRTLEMELRKIVAGSGPTIKPADIDALAVPSGSQVIWRLTDLLGSKKTGEALQFFLHRVERGEDPYGLWIILLNMIKNLTSVVAAMDAGNSDERSIGQVTGIHPFVVRNLVPLARSMTLANIRSLVAWASDADLQLKSGGYHYSPDRQGELLVLAERMMLMLA